MFVLITEIFWLTFWRNNWQSLIDVVERLCLNFFSSTWEQDKKLIIYIFSSNDITALKSPIEYNLGEDIFVLKFFENIADVYEIGPTDRGNTWTWNE